jgi:hypothetical protein
MPRSNVECGADMGVLDIILGLRCSRHIMGPRVAGAFCVRCPNSPIWTAIGSVGCHALR